MVASSIRVPADKIRVIFVSNYYDHPLSGVCAVNGRTYSFEREYCSRWATITRLNRWHRVRLWSKRTAFGICVGWHQHYVNGKKARFYHTRRPRLLHQMLSNLYYGRPLLWRPGRPPRKQKA